MCKDYRQEIIESYSPYHHFAEFHVGLRDYEDSVRYGRSRNNPYGNDSVAAQGWDRGSEAGMKIARAERIAA